MQSFEIQTEIVELPSKGLLYPKDSPLREGTVEMKYMSAKEEDILTNQNYIKKGIVLDKVIQSMITTENVNYNDLLLGDKDALMIAARILGFGSEYSFEYNGEAETVDLSKLDAKPFKSELFEEGKNEFLYTLPHSKCEITFKLLTHEDDKKIDRELEGLKKVSRDESFDISTRLKRTITSVNGDRESKTIRAFVDNGGLITLDSKALRKYIKEIQPGVDLTFFPGDGESKSPIPIRLDFFWPDFE